MKEVCLSSCPHFLKAYLRHSLSGHFKQKDNSENTPSRKVSPLSANILVFRKALNLRYWEYVSSVCPHQCTWCRQTNAWHACEPREGLLLCFAEASAARRSRRLPHSEALRAATRLCCSLLGNAGRARAAERAVGRAAFASTPTLRVTCTTQTPEYRCLLFNIAARSTPTPKFAGTGAVWMQICSPRHHSSPCAPALYLMHELAFSISCTNTCSPPSLVFFFSKPSGSRAEQLTHHWGKEPTCRATSWPHRVRSGHRWAEMFLQGCQASASQPGGFFWSLFHDLKLLFVHQRSGRLSLHLATPVQKHRSDSFGAAVYREQRGPGCGYRQPWIMWQVSSLLRPPTSTMGKPRLWTANPTQRRVTNLPAWCWPRPSAPLSNDI